MTCPTRSILFDVDKFIQAKQDLAKVCQGCIGWVWDFCRGVSFGLFVDEGGVIGKFLGRWRASDGELVARRDSRLG